MLELSGPGDLPTLVEQHVLPAERLVAGEREVAFPTGGDRLAAVTLGAQPLDLPRFSLFAAPDITVSGFRLFGAGERLANDESLVSDPAEMTMYLNRKLEWGQRENIADPFVPPVEPRLVERDGEVLVACSDEPSNFGSWMFRILPKILMGIDARAPAAVFVYCAQPWMRSVIEATGYAGEIIHHEPTLDWRVRDAVIPSLPAPQAFLRPAVRDALWSVHDRAPSDANLGEKLYVSRRGQALKRHGFRVLENETAIVERLVEHGFVEFIPEQHSFRDQLAIFDRARVIVGCGGSNMFGCLFARRAEFIVDLESCDEWVFAHRNVLGSTPAQFAIVRGAQTGRGNAWHRNWVLEDEALLGGLGALGLL